VKKRVLRVMRVKIVMSDQVRTLEMEKMKSEPEITMVACEKFCGKIVPEGQGQYDQEEELFSCLHCVGNQPSDEDTSNEVIIQRLAILTNLVLRQSVEINSLRKKIDSMERHGSRSEMENTDQTGKFEDELFVDNNGGREKEGVVCPKASTPCKEDDSGLQEQCYRQKRNTKGMEVIRRSGAYEGIEKDGRDVEILANEWISVVPKQRRKRIFVSRIVPEVSARDIYHGLKVKKLEVKSVAKLKAVNDDYGSFCITCDEDQYEELMDRRTWPKGAIVREFYGRLFGDRVKDECSGEK